MRRATIVLMFLLLAGCVGAVPVDVASPTLDCGRCLEPSLAASEDGTLFLTTSSGRAILVSRDAGVTWTERAPPPPVNGIDEGHDDATVEIDADERLWFHAIAYRSTEEGRSSVGIHVARSDNGGVTWATNVLLGPSKTVGVDRSWIHVVGDEIHLAMIDGGEDTLGPRSWVYRSTDGGATFAHADRLVRFGIQGPFGAIGTEPFLPRFVVEPAPAGRPIGLKVYAASRASDDIWLERPVTLNPVDDVALPFPVATTDDAGLQLAWRSASGAIVAVRSVDGAQWGTPFSWTPRGVTAVAAPMFVTIDGRSILAYYTESSGQIALNLAWDDGAQTREVAKFAAFPPLDSGREVPANTDYPAIAAMPDGRVALAWTPTKGVLQVVTHSIRD